MFVLKLRYFFFFLLFSCREKVFLGLLLLLVFYYLKRENIVKLRRHKLFTERTNKKIFFSIVTILYRCKACHRRFFFYFLIPCFSFLLSPFLTFLFSFFSYSLRHKSPILASNTSFFIIFSFSYKKAAEPWLCCFFAFSYSFLYKIIIKTLHG